MIVVLPVGGDEEDVLADYDPAIMDIVPTNWPGKPVLYMDVAGPLDSFAYWNDGPESYRKAAGPLRREDVPSCGTDRLWRRQWEVPSRTNA